MVCLCEPKVDRVVCVCVCGVYDAKHSCSVNLKQMSILLFFFMFPQCLTDVGCMFQPTATIKENS